MSTTRAPAGATVDATVGGGWGHLMDTAGGTLDPCGFPKKSTTT